MPPAIPEDLAIVASDLSIGLSGTERIIDGVSFTLPRSGVLAVGGTTGSGKSTLVKTLAGWPERGVRVSGGEARVCGISVRRPGRRIRQLRFYTGLLRQEPALHFPAQLTVRELIALPLTSRQRRVDLHAVGARVAELLDEMHLSLSVADLFPHELSAGMLQRVAFAQAVFLDPRVLIADEPMANIDLEVRHAIFDAIRRRQAAWGMASLLVTNDPFLARELGAASIELHAGHVVSETPAAS